MNRIRTIFALLATVTLVALTPGTASAAPVDNVEVSIACIRQINGERWEAIFGYTNSGAAVRIPVGRTVRDGATYTNALTAGGDLFSGEPVGGFQSGEHPNAFAVQYGGSLSWKITKTVGDRTVTSEAVVSRSTPRCTTGPALPAEGNGTGPALVLGATMLITAGMYVARRRKEA